MAMTEADDTPAEAPIVTPAISVTDLVKTFGEVRAVRGINFEVAMGEVFGFLGPNGAGKSTTINMLCTLTKPTSGHAEVAGFDVVTARDDVRRHIGLVHVVRGHEDRDLLTLLELLDVVPDRATGLGIEADRRLVEKQHPRRVHQTAGDLQPAAHPA